MPAQIQRKWCQKGEHFIDRKLFNKDKHAADGLYAWCAKCTSKYRRDKYNANTEEGRIERENSRYRTLKRRYGITRGEYDALMIFQEGKCGICKTPFSTDTRRIHLDHDHKTGTIRGILCGHCNCGIAFFKDNPTFMERAMQYLGYEEYGDDNVPISYGCEQDV